MTVMGDALMERLSDAGSIPARSIRKAPYLRRFFHFILDIRPEVFRTSGFFCRKKSKDKFQLYSLCIE